MGRQGRKQRSRSEDDENDIAAAEDKDNDPGVIAAETVHFKDLDFAQRRELQRQQAAEKRKSKQKCHLCGNAGHVRRQCPGIMDDGRGMSRYKHKSDVTREIEITKEKKESRQNQGHGDPITPVITSALPYPEEFTKEHGLAYCDVNCNVSATIEYLKSGRGKARISQKEAIDEYQTAMNLATELSNLVTILSRSYLKPNRPWIHPVPFEIENVKLLFLVELTESWKCDPETEQETAIQGLVSSIEDNKEVIAIYSCLDYQPKTRAKKGFDQQSQLLRLQCSWEAAGRTQVPIQIHVLPGAAALDPEQTSFTGTDYAKVLLDLQSNLTAATTKYPELVVHLVGWSGRANHMMAMIQAFPTNLLAVGLDGSVTFTKATHLHECAFELPLDRLALETSTVIPSKVANIMGRMAFFQSGWWPFVAEAVAHYKKLTTVEEVAHAAYCTALKIYPQIRDSSVENSGKVSKKGQEDESMVRKVFVYGTLRDSGSNRHIVADYIDTCAKSCYIHGSLFHFSSEGGRGYFPYAIEKGDGRILGELLTLTDWDAALERLDELEGCPTLYYRSVQTVRFMTDDKKLKTSEAWVYFMQPNQERQGNPIPDGDWIKDQETL